VKDDRWSAGSCFIERALSRIGDAWTLLILRDASRGLTRFDEFRLSLGIAPNILTRRLNGLVKAGLLQRDLYQNHPPRFRYVLTACGRDFLPVLHVMGSWGRAYLAKTEEELPPPQRVPLVIDALTGKPIDTFAPLYP
jgi:DNA-binding HxlR family transcriptional regulator